MDYRKQVFEKAAVGFFSFLIPNKGSKPRFIKQILFRRGFN
jgi:hypothetical protein